MTAQNALKDENSVASAIFENASVAGETRRGQIDQSTGRILVNATSGVVGPVSSTDGAIALWDGATGLVIKNSNLIPGGTVTAPTTTATPVFTSYYGGNTNALGDPVAWFQLKIGATTYKIPLYT